MKLGIFLLIFGLIIATIGILAGPGVESFVYQETSLDYSDVPMLAGLVLGGGMAIGGIIRMIVKR